jgi:predicted metal-dependent peptidase
MMAVEAVKIDENLAFEMDKKIEKCLAILLLDNPFWGSLGLRLRRTVDWFCDTGWTDGISLGYNPYWVETLSKPETIGFLAHEISHDAHLHQLRRQDRDHEKWNQAADFIINDLLLASGFTLPQGHLYNAAYSGKSEEEVYTLIPDMPKGGKGGGKGGGGNGKGGDPGGCGEVRDYPGPEKDDGSGPTGSDNQQHEQDWKIAVSQAAQQARAMGKLPAGLDRWVTDLITPKASPKEFLKQFVEKCARNDYNWAKPNKAYMQRGIHLPSLHSNEMGEIECYIDTSGSMTQEDLKVINGALTEILEEYDATLRVGYVDTKIHNEQIFTRDDLPLALEAKGGGGTDFREPFEVIEQKGRTPVCVIYCTDLCGTFPLTQPEYPVLWCKLGHWGNAMPPWGEYLEID